MRAHVDRALAAIGEGPRDVLDLGVGTGLELPRLLDAGHRVVGVDVSPEMIALCNQRSRPIRCVEADFWRALPFEDASFDAVVAFFGTLAHAPDAGRAPAARARGAPRPARRRRLLRGGAFPVVGRRSPGVRGRKNRRAHRDRRAARIGVARGVRGLRHRAKRTRPRARGHTSKSAFSRISRDAPEERVRGDAVDDAVVVAERHVHDRVDRHLILAVRPLDDDDALLDLAHAQDADVGLVDDRAAEEVALEAGVRDAERRAARGRRS